MNAIAESAIRFSVWQNCYDLQWSGFITKEAFAHPAKFSRGLIERIYDYCLAQGYLRPGDLVGDPFGGIGTGGITAAYRGLRWVGCELEPRFVDLARGNFQLHYPKLLAFGKPLPVIVQGDSRKFHLQCGIERVNGMVTSPPYADSISARESGIDWSKGIDGRDFTKEARHKELRKPMGLEYGTASAQIGALRYGEFSAAITSPPYGDIAAGAGGLNSKPARRAGQQCGRKGGGSQAADQRYGRSEGQISQLKGGRMDAAITSPPYAKSLRGQQDGIDWDKAKQNGEFGQGHGKGRSCHADYGTRPEQIASLPAGRLDGAVTSPPFEDRNACSDPKYRSNRKNGGGTIHHEYGNAEGQIGNDSKETYWEAMRAVYGSCFLAIKPGGVLVVVVKDYVAKKQRVCLCDDTCRLLEFCGFVIVERVQALLVRSVVRADLFVGETTKTTSRKSFFRRLAESKGSPAIDFEEVIIARKLEGGGHA